jgi:pyridoxal phosphate enzyme (YggS family)
MSVNVEGYHQITKELNVNGTRLIAVSKTKPNEDIKVLYELGQRDFGENYVQELVAKAEALPKDIRWHFIGHLQSNKIKYIASFVHLIHGVDSMKLLEAINKEGKKINRKINCLLQVHIAQEETKFGFDEKEALEAAQKVFQGGSFANVNVCGLMGMASFSDDTEQVRREFQALKNLFDKIKELGDTPVTFDTLSMGMSGDYTIAIEEGSNMVRVGSLLFGARNYPTV